MARALLYMQ